MSKSYLGDGVYADVENDMIKLTTEDGIHVTNTIYLEPFVYTALVRYVNRFRNDSLADVAAGEASADTTVDQHRGTQDQTDVQV